MQTYRRLIQEEPRFLEWREGLARFYLERGNRKSAVALWRPFRDLSGPALLSWRPVFLTPVKIDLEADVTGYLLCP